MESVRVQIRLPEDILQELDKMAAESGLTRSSMIRLLVMQAAKGAGTTTRPLEDH